MKTRVLSTFLLTGLLVPLACSSSSSSDDSSVPADSGASDATTDSSSTDGGGDSGIAAECAAFATSYCNFINACEPGTLKSDFGSLAGCVSTRGAQCAIDAVAPGTGVTSTFLTACSASLATDATSCSAGPVPAGVPSPTGPCVLSGAGASGASCSLDSECASGACSRVGSLCGTCDIKGQLGDSCGLATGVTCVPGTQCFNSKCVTIMPVTGTCDLGVTSTCVLGSSCVVATAGATSGTCQANGVAVGTPCDPKAVGAPNCAEIAGMFCDNTSHCAAIQYAATGACGAPDTHVSSTTCIQGACVANACVPDSPAGQACAVDGTPDCAAGTTCVVTGAGPGGTCMAIPNAPCVGATLSENFTFQPSNVTLAEIDGIAKNAKDENVSANCTVTTDASGPAAACFSSKISAVKQPDGSTINLVVVRSLSVQASATITVTGGVPLVIVSLSDVNVLGQIAANSSTSGDTNGPGGGTPANSNAVGSGAGGGKGASNASAIGGGGGSYCGVGGAGGGTALVSAAYGSSDIRPLVGGSSGGGGVIASGAGGGGIQIVAAGNINLRAGSIITVGGGAGDEGGVSVGAAIQGAGGAGSGGSLLLEGQNVTVNGILAANGGGGGGDYANTASDGAASATPAAGAAAGGSGGAGGAGGAGATINGSPGTVAGEAGAGGGGVGRIRINTTSGTAGGTGTYSPAASTTCTTQGTVRTLGSGA